MFSYSFFFSATRTFHILAFALLFVTSMKSQPSAEGGTYGPSPTSIDCQVLVPPGQFILAESFFENIDFAIRRVSFLKAYCFEDASYIHTRCQAFDVEKDIYIVVISKPATNKEQLYTATDIAYQCAIQQDIKLINTRIVQAKR